MARKFFEANDTQYTSKLAEYAVGLRYENIPSRCSSGPR